MSDVRNCQQRLDAEEIGILVNLMACCDNDWWLRWQYLYDMKEIYRDRAIVLKVEYKAKYGEEWRPDD